MGLGLESSKGQRNFTEESFVFDWTQPLHPELEINLKKCSSLPTLSAVAIEVLEHCQNENLDFNEVARVIGRDPALTIKILKMANSPMFGLRNEIRSISQALGILGLNCVRTLVLSFSLVRDSAQERQGPYAAFWKRSVISSIAARELCDGLGQQLKEEAFLAGLLQDVGVMALARAFGNQYKEMHAIAELTHDGLREAEIAAFGADHAEVGAWLLEKWGVPGHLVKLVRYSHDSRVLMDEDPDLYAMARRVEYSGRVADLWSPGSFQARAEMAEAEATALFGEGQIDIAALGARILAAVADVAPLFELKIDDEEMAAVLDAAKEATASSMMRLQTSIVALKSESMRDSLTGLYNRGSLDEHLRQRFMGPNLERMGVVFADIDHFKRINDTHGHAAGDSAIRSVAQRLSAGARGADFVGRYGGEEFLMVVDLAREEDILIVAERIRSAIGRTAHPISISESISITISVGCATYGAGQHHEFTDLVEDADQALYIAKREGRNRVVRALPRVIIENCIAV